MSLWSQATNDARCGGKLQWWTPTFFDCVDVISHYNHARVIQSEVCPRRPTTHDPRPHDPTIHDPRPTTHDPRPTTHHLPP